MATEIVYQIKSVNINQACVLVKHEYRNGRVALSLMSEGDEDERELVCTATVNVPEAPLADGHVLIKDYSENEGVLAELVRNGIVSNPVCYINSGYVQLPVCKLLV